MNPNDSHRLDRDRRLFLKGVAATAAMATVASPRLSTARVAQNDDPLVVGVMGLNGRGSALANGFMGLENARVGYVCDVDSRALEKGVALVTERQGEPPQQTNDYRRMLDDKSLDIVVVATPNHWHAPATIAACAAGKHVYVEKPCSHTAEEGELAVAAARKHNRIVQMGTQRRSWPAIIEAVNKIREGVIGDVHYARSWYNNRRGSVGAATPAPTPEWLDWPLWQGPAPHQPFRENLVHYNWHWFWKWGNGELGNNGVHALDVARWGMDVTFPQRVTAGGGVYRHDDAQETPDTMMVTYDFPGQKTITWEGLSWSPLGPHDSRFGISFHGTEGSIVIHDPGYTIFDMQDKEVSTHTGEGGDRVHLVDFVDAVRTGRLPNADIEQAHRSTLLCHLGNIAYRCSATLQTDPANGHIIDNTQAEQLWSRQYEPGWEPRIG
jgi:predicted dehydrogenase